MFFLRSAVTHERFSLLSTFPNESARPDTVFIPGTSLHLMKFPSAINNEWRSYEYGPGFNFIRKWIGYATINTSAGTFNCIELQLFADNDHDSQPDPDFPLVYQYFSGKGLVEETQSDTLTFSGGAQGLLNRVTKIVQVNF
jgi:hypothetical protein